MGVLRDWLGVTQEIERRLSEAWREHTLSGSTLLNALGYFLHGEPLNEESIRRFAPALAPLRLVELECLARELARGLAGEADGVPDRLRTQIEEQTRTATKLDRNAWEHLTVGEIRKEVEYEGALIMRLAAGLQAALWAVRTPGENKLRVCF